MTVALVLAGTLVASFVILHPARNRPNGNASADTVQMTSVTAAQLAQANLTLYQPIGTPATTQQAAEQTAESLYHADSVLESKLALVDDAALRQADDYPGGAPGLHRLAWVVVLPPRFAPPLDPPVPRPGQTPLPHVYPTYLIVVVDAVTGKALYDSMGVA